MDSCLPGRSILLAVRLAVRGRLDRRGWPYPVVLAALLCGGKGGDSISPLQQCWTSGLSRLNAACSSGDSMSMGSWLRPSIVRLPVGDRRCR